MLKKYNSLIMEIEYCVSELKQYPIDVSPLKYASTQENLGDLYYECANIEQNAENYRNAAASYGEALKVFTSQRKTVEIAEVQFKLGVLFAKFAENNIGSRIENFDKSVRAFEEALSVYNADEYREKRIKTQSRIGLVYQEIARMQSRTENYGKAIKLFGQILDKYDLADSPRMHCYALVDVDPSALKVSVYKHDGELYDTVTLDGKR